MYEPYLMQIGMIDRTRAAAWPLRAPTNTLAAISPAASRGSSEQIGVLLATLTHGLAYALRVVFFGRGRT